MRNDFFRPLVALTNAALLVTVMTASVHAQIIAPPATHSTPDTSRSGTEPDSQPGVTVSPESPRAAVEQFLSLTRTARFEAAAAYLALPDSMATNGATLARQLKAVLDRDLLINETHLSPLAAGDTADGFARNVEQLGTIARANGTRIPVRLVRGVNDSTIYWRFSAATVASIPEWYSNLPDRWVLEHLPALLVRTGPFDILWWQWLALPVLLGLAIVVSWLCTKPVLAVVRRLVARSKTDWDDAVVASVQSPLTVALTLAIFAASLTLLTLYQPANDLVLRCIRAGYFIVFFWTLWRLVDVGRMVVSASRWAAASTSSRALVPLASRVTKVAVLAVAVVGFLSLLGYPVASLLAGLGLGGLALALAAQKTVENLFGAFSIGIDQPFREGDFVKVEDFVGTVEQLGLRATRFRTLDRTVISVPNGRLAEMRLESMTARDRMRFAATIGLIYGTTGAQMREVLRGFESALRQHPKIWPDAVVVRFKEFGASSLDIEIMAWFEVPEWSDFQLIRQNILLQFMDIVEQVGTGFAFPTRTIHVASLPERDRENLLPEPGRTHCA